MADLWDTILSTGVQLGADVILQNRADNAARDAAKESRRGSTAQQQTGLSQTTGTATEHATGVTTTLSDILAKSGLDEKTQQELLATIGTTQKAGTAESDAALSTLLQTLDPSKFTQDKAVQMGEEASRVAVSQTMDSVISDILGAGTKTGTFGSTAQAQLAQSGRQKAQLAGTTANLQAQQLASTLRGNEVTNLVDAIRAAQAGTTTSAQTQSQTTTGGKQSETTDTSQQTNTQTATQDSTTSTQQKAAQLNRDLASTTDKPNTDWLGSQFAGSGRRSPASFGR